MSTVATLQSYSSTSDVLLADGCSVRRTLVVPDGEVRLVAAHDGYGWKATIDVPSVVGQLEFHGLFPKSALDGAEEFVRNRVAAEGRL